MASPTTQGGFEEELEQTALVSADEDVAPVATDEPGRRLGRYVLISELGRGGMGVVFAAYDPQLDRRVAVKLIHASSQAGEARLRREAKALAQLTHPNVVTIYEVGDHEGRVFIAMEYVQGQTLKRWLAEEERSQRDKMAVLLAAAEGLQAAHEMGLVHRDFKPDNVMVGDDGRVRVMDFGLVVMSGTPSEDAVGMSTDGNLVEEAELTATGSVMGTPRYMAPEQFMSKPTTPATDQFSFCLCALEALAGVHPIGGTSYAEIFRRVTTGHRHPDVSKNVPKWIRDVLLRGLTVDPEERWPSMAELQAELRKDPRRKRLAILAVGVVALGAAASVATVEARDTMRANACAEQGRALEPGWSAPRREQVGSSLSAVPHLGEATAQRVLPILDDFAATWSQARTDACMDSSLTEANLQHQANSCLNDAQRRFEGLVQRLGERPDIEVVRAAVKAASDLPEPARCLDRAWLVRQPELPADKLDEVEEIEALLASGSAAASLMRYDEAQSQIEVARKRAEALGWPPLMARVDLNLGHIESSRGDHAAGQRHTQRGRVLALAAGDVDAAIQAAAAELHMLEQLDRLEDAVALREAFEPIVERFATPDTRSELEWLLALGQLATARAEFEDAEAYFAQAQELAAKVLGEGHPQHARTWLLRASLAERRQRSDLADERITRALEIGRTVFGPDHPSVSAMRNVEAMVRFDRGQIEEGLRILQELAETSARVLGPEHPATLDYLSNLATREAMSGRLEQARARMEFVLEAERKRNPRGSGVASALTNLGTLAIDQGRNEEGIALLKEALELHIETSGHRTLAVANTAMNLGATYSEMGRYDEAVPYLEQALALFEDMLPGSRPVAHITADLGMVESRTRGADVAQARLQRGRELLMPFVGEDSELIAALDSYLAVSWALQGDFERAEELLASASAKVAGDDVDPRTKQDLETNRARVEALSSGK